jgi:sugar lactone lactonase YvrE
MSCKWAWLTFFLPLAAPLTSHAATQDIISTYAGGIPTGIPVLQANVVPLNVALDNSGTLYIVGDSLGSYYLTGSQDVVFKVTGSTLTLLAGTGYGGDSGDGGPATQATLHDPWAAAVDTSKNVYIVDAGNCVIRKVTAATGIISTIAGQLHSCGYSGDGGPATSAQLGFPLGVALDSSGNLYIADAGSQRIRVVSAATGNITTLAGNGTPGYSGDGGAAISAELDEPASVALDAAGNVYIADSGNFRIREVTASSGIINTIAGDGTNGFSGDGGPATSAAIGDVTGIAADSAGDVFLADQNNQVVREVFKSTGIINTIAGNYLLSLGNGGYSGDGGPATSALLNFPTGVAVSGSSVYIADSGNYRVREVTGGIINTVAGDGSGTYSAFPVAAIHATLDNPSMATVDASGNLYIADTWNNVIRKINTSGVISTLAGNGQGGYSGDGGPATSAQLFLPGKAVADSAGDLYIADTFNCVVRKVTAATGDISTIAGQENIGGISGCGYAGDGGPATSAQIFQPRGLTLDAADNVYIADTVNCLIRKITASTGIISTIVGNYTSRCSYSGDGGPATSAQLNDPEDVALDSAGNLYIADSFNNVVRVVNSSGIITTFAGNGTGWGTGNGGFSGDGGPATAAELWRPVGIAVDAAGDVLIDDSENVRIRWVDKQGIIYTIAGNGNYGASGNGGAATSATLSSSFGVAVGVSGNIYITDSGNNLIRKVTAIANLNASAYKESFASQAIGTTSAVHAITLTGVGPLNISGFSITGDFAQTNNCPATMTSGSKCTVDVTFTPTAADTRTGTLTISTNGLINPTITINLTGQGGGTYLSKTSLSFGQVTNGQSSAVQTTTLSNVGTATLTSIGASVAGANQADFTFTTTCGTTLAPGAHCTFSVTFKPSLVGAESAALNVTDNEGTVPVSLSGTGIGTGLAPRTLSFGLIDHGSSKKLSTKLSNAGTASLTLSTATVTGTNASDFTFTTTCGSTLAAGAFCYYTVTFKPTGAGAESATLNVIDNEGTFPVSLNGSTTNTSISPTSLAFGTLIDGSSSALSNTVSNEGTASLTSLSAGISGTNSSNFTFTTTCGTTLAAGASCSYTVKFQPTGSGSETAALNITDNEGTFPVSLTGTAQATSISPTSLPFGEVGTGSSKTLSTTVSNQGTAALTSISATVTGNDASEFTFTTTCGSTLAPASSCTFSVTFTPTTTIEQTATLNIKDSENSSPGFPVSLSGGTGR